MAGPGGPGKPSKMWGASPLTFLKACPGPRGRPDLKNATHKIRPDCLPVLNSCTSRGNPTDEVGRFVPHLIGRASLTERPFLTPTSTWVPGGSHVFFCLFLLFPPRGQNGPPNRPHRDKAERKTCFLGRAPEIIPVGYLKAVWPNFGGCVFEVWPAPGARESLQKCGGPRPPHV